MAANIAIETQKILIQTLNDIFAKNQQYSNVITYVAVPLAAKLPYIKITTIDVQNTNTVSSNGAVINIELSIFAHERSNQTICNVIEVINDDLVQQLIDKKTTLICISNAMPQGYSIKESIEKDAFIGIYRIRLVANII